MYIIEYMNEGTSHWVQTSSNTSETAAIVNARNQLKRSNCKAVRVKDKNSGAVVFIDSK